MTKNSDYRAIAAWNRRLGSYGPYIADQQDRARMTGAPITAIYQRKDGSWATVEDIKDDTVRHEIEDQV